MDHSRWETWLSVCWTTRREGPVECAERALEMTNALDKVDDCFKTWSIVPRRKAIPFVPGLATLEELMLAGRHWNDEIPPRVIERLGYSTGFLAGGTDFSRIIQFSISCGQYAGVSLNGVNMEIRNECPAASRVVKVNKLCEILAVLARSWEPNWGSVRLSDLHDHRWPRPDYNGFNPSAGWLTYLSSQRGALPTLPARFRVVPVESRGNIVIAMEEHFDPENEAHVEAVNELNCLLGEAGLLSPLQNV